jgi:hypothetical protein
MYPDLTPLLNEKIGSRETDMNLFGSPPNHENRTIYDGLTPQGLSEARRAGSFIEFLVTDPPRGRPFVGRRQSSYQMDKLVTITALT